jgi:hypothetical protein
MTSRVADPLCGGAEKVLSILTCVTGTDKTTWEILTNFPKVIFFLSPYCSTSSSVGYDWTFRALLDGELPPAGSSLDGLLSPLIFETLFFHLDIRINVRLKHVR